MTKVRRNILLRNLVLQHMTKNSIAYPQEMMQYNFGKKICTIQFSDGYFSTEFLERDAAGNLCAEVFGDDLSAFDLHKHISENYFADLINIYCYYNW